MLKVDQILIGGSKKPAWYDNCEVIFDFGAVLTCGDSIPYTCDAERIGAVRAMKLVATSEAKQYIVAANFGSEPFAGEVFEHSVSLASGDAVILNG